MAETTSQNAEAQKKNDAKNEDSHWILAKFGSCWYCGKPMCGRRAWFVPIMQKLVCFDCAVKGRR